MDRTSEIIEIKEAAVDKIAELIAMRKRGPLAVRVILLGDLPGGGFQSEFKFVDEAEKEPDDTVQDAGPFKLIFDPETAKKIQGAVVDYDPMRHRAGFNISYSAETRGIPSETEKSWDDPLAQSVQDLVAAEINPGLAGHGGWMLLLGVEEDTVYIELGGGCHGCGLSTVTLSQGIERIITERIPAIKRVIDNTDHAEGQNPYYAGSHPSGGDSALKGK